MKASDATRRDERTSVLPPSSGQTHSVFESLFERSADAIWLYDPETRILSDCNQAAVQLMGAKSKAQFLPARPEDISPASQGDGCATAVRTAEVTEAVQ